MKIIFNVVCLMMLSSMIFGQVFPLELDSKWEFKDETNKLIVITYDLADIDGLRYLKVTTKAYVDNRLIPMRSLKGDIGESIKVGKNKQISWSWENDVVEIDGDLRFEVIADDPLGGTGTTPPPPPPPAIPLAKVLGLPLSVGGGLAVTGLLSTAGAKSEWNDIATSDRTTDEYDKLSGKYKTGQYLAVAGGAIIVAGVIWYLKEKAALKSNNSLVSVSPHIGDLTSAIPQRIPAVSNYGLTLNYKF